jgi:hypothetical protein
LGCEDKNLLAAETGLSGHSVLPIRVFRFKQLVKLLL